jgi:hypothetical protein
MIIELSTTLLFVQKKLRLGARSLVNETSGLEQVRHKPWMLSIFLVKQNLMISAFRNHTN